MKHLLVYFCVTVAIKQVLAFYYNETVPDAVAQQLPEFRRRNPKPVGVWTTITGDPIDVRDTTTLNSDIFNNKQHFLLTAHFNRERIPERVVHAKGIGAYGYFEVTNDVSKYIMADVFNGIGKRTPAFGRFSTAIQNIGGSDLTRETKGLALKLYTKQGNLDLVCIHLPIFLYREPLEFMHFAHAFKRNPRTNTFDNNMRWDFITTRPEFLHTIFWLNSDFGLPDGYRKMDIFPIHTYEIYNKHGEKFYARFNFRTELGLFNLTDAQAGAIGISDPDYFNRDLYNAIAKHDYPSWRLELDILTTHDLPKLNYDPFDVTRLWKRGTYRTVTVGRLIMNRRVDNDFRDHEQSAFCPDNLVPGIVGGMDEVFKARRIFYSDSQNYRLGSNHNNIRVNDPIYARTYNRDGRPPVLDNTYDAPNYYPNSFNGYMPYVDENRPSEKLFVLHRTAVDLQPLAEFYNEIVDSDAHRQRIIQHFAESLVSVAPDIEKKAIRLLSQVNNDLGRRVKTTVRALRKVDQQRTRARLAQCIENA